MSNILLNELPDVQKESTSKLMAYKFAFQCILYTFAIQYQVNDNLKKLFLLILSPIYRSITYNVMIFYIFFSSTFLELYPLHTQHDYQTSLILLFQYILSHMFINVSSQPPTQLHQKVLLNPSCLPTKTLITCMLQLERTHLV